MIQQNKGWSEQEIQDVYDNHTKLVKWCGLANTDEEAQNFSLKGKKVIVQGFGNVGRWAAHFFHNEGAIITGVIEYNGEIYNENGINPDDLDKFINGADRPSIKEFPGCQVREDLLYENCDILLACAKESVIHKNNASRIQANVICEGANGPITPCGHDILVNDNNCLIVPDLYANAGGVFVSYCEWLKNRQGGSLSKIKDSLYDEIMSNSELSEAQKVDESLSFTMFRSAASIIKRLGPKYQSHGVKEGDVRLAALIRSEEHIIKAKLSS